MVKLDLKDRRLLHELDLNSRKSFKEIGKKSGLSKDSVVYRIKKLQQEGVIQSFHAVIDLSKLGGLFFRLYIKYKGTTTNIENEIINFLKNQKIVTWIVSIDGEYDLGIGIYANSRKEMADLEEVLMKKYGNYIERKWLTLWSKITYYPRTYILGKENHDEFVFISDSEKENIDKKDMEILKFLALDSRIPIINMANRLKLNPKTIISRIKNLEKRKIVLGYRTFLDITKLGYKYFKLHINFKSLSKKEEQELNSFIKEHPNIIYNNEVLGGDDVELDIQLKSVEELRELISSIKDKFKGKIKNYKYMSFYKEHKYSFFPA